VDEWIKMWYIHATEYYSAMIKKEILLYETTWIELDSIMLTEINQIEKDKYCVILLNM